MKPVGGLAALAAACCLAVALTACTGGQRRNVLVPDGSPSVAVMDFRQPLALDPLPDGWHHRRFFGTDPMQIGFATKEGRPSIRLATHGSGSMLYRFTLYRKHWGDPQGASLQEVALFCDTDATGGQSVAYFSAVSVEHAPAASSGF